MKTFESIRNLIENSLTQAGSIGTQQERWIHQAIKYYLSDDPMTHEIAMDGYVVDVLLDGEIYEVQTGAVWKLTKKLVHYLPHYPVHVVIPLIYKKTTITLNEYGIKLSERKSPRVAKLQHIALIIEPLFSLLNNPNLSVMVVMIEVDEYRRKSELVDRKLWTERIPKGTPIIHTFHRRDDYKLFLPETLPNQFTRTDYQTHVRLSSSAAMAMMRLLTSVGLLEQVGKQGRYHLYQRRQETV
jgi:hypothetical protein